MKTLNAIIVNNSTAPRQELSEIIRCYSSVNLVGAAVNGSDAIMKILLHQPEILFLDISITEPDSMEVLKEIWLHYKPFVIFTKNEPTPVFSSNAVCCVTRPYNISHVLAVIGNAKALEPGQSQPGMEEIISLTLGEAIEDL